MIKEHNMKYIKNNNLILEDGYNTDYIYCLLVALFYVSSEGTNKIINNDTNNSDTYYIQEFIKSKFIYPLQRSVSIDCTSVNKLRLFLYMCGWLKDEDKNILEKVSVDKFYNFLVFRMMEYNISFSLNCADDLNKEHKCDMIRITKQHLYDDNCIDSKIVSLSSIISKWIQSEILGTNKSYKFEPIPYIVPIYLDIRDANTGLNERYINIMEGINFDNGDIIQRTLIWDLHSIICQTEKGDYYTIIIDDNDMMVAFSDKHIPSNWFIDRTNLAIVKRIMSEVRFVFYKLQ
jgi:hypothetical protein